MNQVINLYWPYFESTVFRELNSRLRFNLEIELVNALVNVLVNEWVNDVEN